MKPISPRAGAESPGAYTGDRAAAEAFSRRLAKELGIEPTREAFSAVSEQHVFEAQKKLTDAALGAGMMKSLVTGTASPLLLAPVVDGDLLPQRVEDALAHGVGAAKKLLIGATANEFDQTAAMFPKILDRIPRRLILRGIGMKRHPARAYAAGVQGKTCATVAHLLTDLLFRCYVADLLAARSNGHTFAYDFRLANPDTGLAGHCIELPFAWDCLDGANVAASAGPKPPQEIADLVHGAWVRFIAEGDPGWPAYDPHSRHDPHDPRQRSGLVVDREPRVAPVFAEEAEAADWRRHTTSTRTPAAV